MPKQFRKKSVVISAIQYLGNDNIEAVKDFCSTSTDRYLVYDPETNAYSIQTLEGRMALFYGDWIICGVKGEFYQCKPDIFEQTYEAV